MSNQFKYSHSKQLLEEMPGMEPDMDSGWYGPNQVGCQQYQTDYANYKKHLASLRSFSYSLPIERDGEVLELDKDFMINEIDCEICGGDGKETCTNPDHGFIESMPGETGRLGCPVCGHDSNHKVKNGGPCDECNGTGKVKVAIPIPAPLAIPVNAATGTGEGEGKRSKEEMIKNYVYVFKSPTIKSVVMEADCLMLMEQYASQFRAAPSNEVKSDAVEGDKGDREGETFGEFWSKQKFSFTNDNPKPIDPS